MADIHVGCRLGEMSDNIEYHSLVKYKLSTYFLTMYHWVRSNCRRINTRFKYILESTEGISGRGADDITSTYEIALLHERDVDHVVYWADNCSAQNKNWTLYTALTTLVNYSGQHDFQDMTLKYFEPGHTFMSADSVHAAVAKLMRRRPDGFVYDLLILSVSLRKLRSLLLCQCVAVRSVNGQVSSHRQS